VANALGVSAVIVERLPNDFVIVASAPWTPTLQTLDRVALDECFRSGDFAGAGSAFSAGSDWLFVPIHLGDEVAASFGLAGQYCRRRFDPKSDPTIAAVQDALEAAYRAELPGTAMGSSPE
jgi:hypothetical protein